MENPLIVVDLHQDVLNNLLSATRASAIGILQTDSDRFVLRAGDFSETAFMQLSKVLQKYWAVVSDHALNRYVGLNLDGRFYLVFAKFLPQGNYLLNLVFHLQIPLVRIRQDMTETMRLLLEKIRGQIQRQGVLERSLQFILKSYPASDQEQSPRPDPTRTKAKIEDHADYLKDNIVPDHPAKPLQDFEIKKYSNTHGHDVQPQSENVPFRNSPLQEVWIALDEMLEESPRSVVSEEGCPGANEPPGGAVPGAFNEDEIIKSVAGGWQSLDDAQHSEGDLAGLFHEDYVLQASHIQEREERFTSEAIGSGEYGTPVNISSDITRPHAVEGEDDLERIKVSDITFYLVPHQNRHFLLGILARRLREWFPRICETYGWELAYLSIRPDYVKWTLHDFPDALIHEMLEIVRRRTSERIFRIFPNLQAGSQTGDFWSPGYLVDRQNREFSTQVLIAHVTKSRLNERDS